MMFIISILGDDDKIFIWMGFNSEANSGLVKIINTLKNVNYLGNIHVLRNHKGGREGVSQMLTIAYGGGGQGVILT